MSVLIGFLQQSRLSGGIGSSESPAGGFIFGSKSDSSGPWWSTSSTSGGLGRGMGGGLGSGLSGGLGGGLSGGLGRGLSGGMGGGVQFSTTPSPGLFSGTGQSTQIG